MGDYHQPGGFLYCWKMNETLLVSPVHGGLLQGSIHHGTVSIPSSAQGIASFSSTHRFFLIVSFRLPILVHLL
jgi:hypothetical protein